MKIIKQESPGTGKDAYVIISEEDLATWNELRGKPKEVLTSLQRQCKYIFELHLQPSSCPLCGTLVASAEKSDVPCPVCGVGLHRITPLFGPPSYLWVLSDESKEEILHLLRRAKANKGGSEE